jgi:NAD(P)H dehydrogenase (quinone)
MSERKETVKISIIYHSSTGNTKKLAETIASGAEKVEGAEVKIASIDEIDKEFLEASGAVIIGTPVYLGTFSWQIKKWLDTYREVNLSGKLGAVFATENTFGGGADIAELALVGQLLVKGLLVYSAGVSQGQPSTHFGTVSIKDGDEAQKERAVLFGERIARKAKELFAKDVY